MKRRFDLGFLAGFCLCGLAIASLQGFPSAAASPGQDRQRIAEATARLVAALSANNPASVQGDFLPDSWKSFRRIQGSLHCQQARCFSSAQTVELYGESTGSAWIELKYGDISALYLVTFKRQGSHWRISALK